MTELLGNDSEHLSAVTSSPFEHLTSPETLGQVAREYLFDFGWSTRVSGRTLELVLGHEQAAVLVPTHWASDVLDHLAFQGLCCPVLRIPGYAWGFLTTCDRYDATGPVPAGTRVLPPGSAVSLPPTPTEYGDLSWIQAPQPTTGLDVTVDDIAIAIGQVVDTVSAALLPHQRPALPGLTSPW